MDSTSLLQSMQHNNEGVGDMASGRFEDAVINFARSLEILQPALPIVTPTHEPIDSDEASVSEDCIDGDLAPQMECCAGPLSGGSPVSHTPPSCDGTTKNSAHDTKTSLEASIGQCLHSSGFIFRDPIQIPIRSVARNAPTRKIVVKLSIVGMYNLALAFHLSASSGQAQQPMERLELARQVYECAFRLHLKENCDVTLLYSLAIMNNLGLIYRIMDEAIKSDECFQNMLSTMMFLLESNEAQAIKQWDGLLSNVMTYVFQFSETVSPAA